MNNIKRKIAIISGKGGVGKSFVTASISSSLSARGYSVGILDADITGPSIPVMFGLSGRPSVSGKSIIPMKTKSGIKVMSMDLISEGRPIVWRGPLLSGATKQFFSDVVWGDIDYLLMDLPPGTGDIPLTVFQSFELAGVLIVRSPQTLVGSVVGKSIEMAKMMDIPIIGIVENMYGFSCPKCGCNLNPFGNDLGDITSKEKSISVLGRIPIDPDVARLCDKGQIEKYKNINVESIVDSILSKMGDI